MALSLPSTSKSKKTVIERQNVQAVVRVRPFNILEEEQRAKNIIKYLGTRDILTKEKRFRFDKVFQVTSTQLEVYKDVVAPMIPDLLSGYNCTVFAYGQTGSGKTYTMSGASCEVVRRWDRDLDAGIIPRAASHIFDMLSSQGQTASVKVSYLELYNEEIRDLFSVADINLSIYNNYSGSVVVQGLTEVNVFDKEGICNLLQKGNSKRQTAPTCANHYSSRSHTVFTIIVVLKETNENNDDVVKEGKINFVDLAGSENIARSGCKELRAVELANINKSLLTLGRVIQALADKGKRHVPYRDSKLTRILQDSLGGHTKTCIIATVSPAATSSEETLSTLEYACRARDIKNCPTVNEKIDQKLIVENLLELVKSLKLEVTANRKETGFYISKGNYEEMLEELDVLREFKMSINDTLEDRDRTIQDLQTQLETKDKEYKLALAENTKSKELLEKQQGVINEKKMKLKTEKFVSKTFEHNLGYVHREAEDLVAVSETLAEQCALLQKKIEHLLHIINTNDLIVRRAVCNMFEVINEIVCQANEITQMTKDICGLCQNDIDEFKKSLQASLSNLAKVFDKYDTTLFEDTQFKEYIVELLDIFIFRLKVSIHNIKADYTDYVNDQRRLVCQLVHNVDAVFVKFIKSIEEMLNKKASGLEKGDTELLNLFKSLQQDFSERNEEIQRIDRARMESDETWGKKLAATVNHLEGRKREPPAPGGSFKEYSNLARSDLQEATGGLSCAMAERRSDFNLMSALNNIVNEITTFRRLFEINAESAENSLRNCVTTAGAALRESVFNKFQEAFKSAAGNYDTLGTRFTLVVTDRRTEQIKLKDYVMKIDAVLVQQLLNGTVVPTPDGTSPPAPPEVKLTKIAIPSREQLLRKFRGLPDASEDKKNIPGFLNVSTASLESFRTYS